MFEREPFRIAISEWMCVFFINASLVAFLLPAVNQAAYTHGNPQILAWLPPFAADNGWPIWLRWVFVPMFGLITGLIPAGVLLGVRRLLPKSQRDRIVWARPPQMPKPNIIEESPRRQKWGTSLVAPVFALVGTGLLLYVATRVQVDRSHRRPVVTWSELSVDQVNWLSVTAWAISVGAFVLVALELKRGEQHLNARQRSACVAGMAIAIANLLGSCFFYGIVYED
mgnify:CR=1 FL=1